MSGAAILFVITLAAGVMILRRLGDSPRLDTHLARGMLGLFLIALGLIGLVAVGFIALITSLL